MTRKRPLALVAALACTAACSTGPSPPAVGPPGAPSGVMATAGIHSANLGWSAPANDGGAAVTGYQVIASPAAPLAVIEISGTRAAVTGLANGTTYRFSVTALNSVGTSAASDPSAPVTTPDVPAAPTGVTAAPADRAASVDWSAPRSTGGSAVTGYGVVIAPAAGSAVVQILGTHATVTGLANGTAYAFRVYATNAVGDGPMSAPSGAVTPLRQAGTPIGPGHDDDPFLSQQWHLHNSGQTGFAQNAGIAGNDIHADLSYAAGFGGRGVKVAVVDSGLEVAHEDLAANVVPGSWNFVSGTTDPTSTAADGDHGTSVAGLIAAVRANGKGGMGVAPMATLNGYNYVAGTQTTASFTAAMGAGTGVGGPRSFDVSVFNQSFGLSTVSPVGASATREAQYLDGVTHLRGGLGAVYVKSAGNGFQDYEATPSNPDCSAANAAHVSCENASMDPYNTLPMNVVVAALDANGKRSSYSTAGAAIWVSAPGGEFGLSGSLVCGSSPCPSYYFDPAMITTDQSGCSAGFAQSGVVGSPFDAGGLGNAQCNYTNGFNGTSSAAPVVSGVVALLLEANPSLSWRDVKHILASTARKVDPGIAPVTRALSDGTYTVEPGWVTNGAGYAFHDWYGFGGVDVDQAIALASGYVPGTLAPMNTPAWVAGAVPASSAIPDHSVAGVTGTVTIPAASAVQIEAVQVRVSTDHRRLGDLAVELTSPAGTRSVLLNALNGFGASSGTVTVQLASNAFYAESSGGTWTLKVVDAAPANTGRLVAWQIRIYGH